MGNNSVWHHNTDEFIYLFSGVMADEEDAEPTLTLEVEGGDEVYEVSYDETRNILYAYVYDSSDGDYIAIFDDATKSEDGDGPTRVLSGFEGELYSLVVDPRTDRLFVFHEADTDEWEYHVFNNVSTLEGGDQADIDHLVIEFEFDDEFYGASYDFKNDRIWTTSDGGATIYIIDNASNPTTPLVVRSLRETVLNRNTYSPNYWQTIYHTVRDRLFVTDYNGVRVLIYENASQIGGLDTVQNPDISVEGDNTEMEKPDGIVLFR